MDDEPIYVREQATSQEDAPPPPAFAFVDRRPFAKPSMVTWQRPLSAVTGICLHQTACHMGERDDRYDKLNVHAVVTRSGKIIVLHDPTTGLCAANGWNNGTVSVEFDGLYSGLADRPDTTLVNEAMRTTWDDPTTPFRETPQELTAESVESGRALIRWWAEQLPALNVIVAHRQSSGSRQSDPGEAIWRAVALPTLEELGLHDGGAGFKLDDGYALPDAWTGQPNGTPY